MRHSGVRIYTRPQELRFIEDFAELERTSSDMLGHSSWRKLLPSDGGNAVLPSYALGLSVSNVRRAGGNRFVYFYPTCLLQER